MTFKRAVTLLRKGSVLPLLSLAEYPERGRFEVYVLPVQPPSAVVVRIANDLADTTPRVGEQIDYGSITDLCGRIEALFVDRVGSTAIDEAKQSKAIIGRPELLLLGLADVLGEL
jgi:hypothetical protein